MQTALIFLALGFFVYAVWSTISLPFSPGKRLRKFWKAIRSLVASMALVVTFGISSDRNAHTAGFLSMSDQTSAEKAGITDPVVWGKVREQELFKQRQAEAAALEVENARKREEGIAAAEEASRIAEAKEAENAREEAQVAAAKLAEQEECKKDLQCWGEEAALYGKYDCSQLIERMSKHDFEWTDGLLEPKFSHYRWRDPEAGTVTIIGDKIKMQNGFGAWTHMTYECDFNPTSRKVLDVRVAAGRI